MAKRVRAAAMDFDVSVDTVIPSTQEAFCDDGFGGQVRAAEKENLVRFREILGLELDKRLAGEESFPSDREVFVFILQYFAAEKEYARRDIDNMAKTVLDVLKERFYHDDSQVKTLLVGKKRTDNRVNQNFAYVAVKMLRDGQDAEALKISGAERAVTLFQESRSKAMGDGA
jgi:hypothetical protein